MDYNYLEKLITQGLNTQDPMWQQLLGNATRKIGMTTDRNVRNIKQQNAQSGFRGIGANAINDAYRTESQAVGDVSGQIAQQQMAYRQNAIQQLLGLKQMESQETGFGDIIGGLLGMGAGALGGGYLGALGKKWAG